MSGSSPSVVLYTSAGTELDVQTNTAIPSGTGAILISGVSPSGASNWSPATADGILGFTQMANHQTVQSAATVTASGSFTTSSLFAGAQEMALIVDVGTVTGAGTITYTIQEIDTVGNVYGNSATTATISTGNAPGVFTAVLNITTAMNFKVTWTVASTFSATITSYVVSKSTPSTQTVNGTLTASNPSVSTIGATAPTSATYIGGLVTTAAESALVNGDLYALNMTTTGQLRIDGVYPLATAVATAVDMDQVGGVVTTAAPTYTTATINALSLDTTGNLRVLANQPTAANLNATIVGLGTAGTPSGGVVTIQGASGGTPIPISGTVTATNASVSTTGSAAPASATYAGALVTTAAESGLVSGDMYGLNMTTTGQLRIDGVYPLATAVATAVDMDQVGGVVTTAAPTYTTATVNALSLDTTGNLRVLANQPTAANLNATIVGSGSAGTPATGVVTIQGIASGTAINVTSSFADATATGALGALNAAVQITTAGYNGVGMQLAAGTLIGTLVAEVSFDGGTTWNGTFFNNVSTSSNTTTIVFASSNTATAATLVGAGGTGLTRVRVSAYTSGTANATLRASEVKDPSTLNGGPAGGTLPPVIGQNGGSVTTAAPTYTTGTLNALSLDTSGNLRTLAVGSTAAGSGASTGLVTVQGNASGTPIPVSGTVTATNASVSAVAAAPPTSATYVGASVTTAAPTYTTGQMDPLSLTTGGLLRIDGVYPLNAATPTSDITFVGASVTTAAPAYTTGNLSALSLTTVGGLRVDGVYAQGTANASAPDVGVSGGYATTSAPTYTTGQLNPLSLDTAGNLRVTAITNKSTTSNVTSVAGATSNTSVLAANTARVFASVYNNTNKNMYILCNSGTASTTNFSILLITGSYWEVPSDYQGAINAVWATGVTGNALITEFTP